MKQTKYLLLVILFSLSIQSNISAQNQQPPIAKKIFHETKIHNETLVDNYFWFREKTNPELLDYFKAENDYADALMRPTEELQKKLYDEMLRRIKETDVDVPYLKGNYYYYTKTEKGKQYASYCRKKVSTGAKEEMVLDVNELAMGHKYFGVGSYEISDDGNLLAYTIDTTGFRQYILQVKDLKTGKLLEDYAERVVDVVWCPDNKTIFYIQEDAVTKRSDKFFRHTLGSNSDKLVYEEKDEMFDVGVGRTRSGDYIFVTSVSKNSSEVRFLNTGKPDGELTLILPRKAEHQYFVDHIGKNFYIRTDDMGKNFRLVTAPVEKPGRESWKEIIPHRKDVMLESINCFSEHFITTERHNGIRKFNITDLKSGKSHFIQFPEDVYTVGGSNNELFKTNSFRLSYQSFITPYSIYDYDVKRRKLKLLKQMEVLGGYKPEEYQSERIYTKASDGTSIPISLVFKKELVKDGKRPLFLYGYGSYGASMEVGFNSSRLSLLDRGFIYAIAHIRGGGEMGKMWYEDGKLMKKKNTFTDFIACAEHLIKEKYTSSDKLAISGGSAGGLLMGAVTNMRPDLFKVVLSYVPFVDVINTMLDASLPLTTQEYLEWGNPNEKEAYNYMMSYSPYDNLEAKNYPTMLVRTSLNDSQVMYWEPSKYVAKLRSLKTDSNPLLFKIKLDPGGHGGSSGRYDRLKDLAFDYAFLFHQMGIK